jgi:hypothetical protein
MRPQAGHEFLRCVQQYRACDGSISQPLFGGGMIAGDALAAVGIGIASLLAVLT